MSRLNAFSAFAIDQQDRADVLGGMTTVIQNQVIRNRALAQTVRDFYNSIPDGTILMAPMHEDITTPRGGLRRIVYTYNKDTDQALKTVYLFKPGEPIWVW